MYDFDRWCLTPWQNACPSYVLCVQFSTRFSRGIIAAATSVLVVVDTNFVSMCSHHSNAVWPQWQHQHNCNKQEEAHEWPVWPRRPNGPWIGLSQKKEPLPIAWTKTWIGNDGKKSRIFHFTMGSAVDFQNEGVRRLTVNAVYWNCHPKNNRIIGTA